MPNPQTHERVTRWLITGGCGFIGTNLIKNLLTGNRYHIRVLDDLSAGSRRALARVCRFSETGARDMHFRSTPALDKPVQLVVGTVLDPELCMHAARGMDVIVHLAGNTGVEPSIHNPGADLAANVMGTFNMLEAARQNKLKKIIYASSNAAVGASEPPIHEELAPHPVSPYGASKLAAEGYCTAYYHTFGLETVSLRFGNVYGPGSGHKDSVVARFVKRAMADRPLEIHGEGDQTRDFIYIDDLVLAIRASVGAEGVGGEVFQIAANAEITINELVETLVPILLHAGIPKVRVVHGRPRAGDVLRNYSNITKANKRLRWTVKTGLIEGLKKVVADLCAEYRGKPGDCLP